MMKAMQIHRYGGPEQLTFDDIPVPQAGPGQVLVRVHASSVNPWDYKLASGAFRDFVPIQMPYIPGGEFSGVIEDIGLGVTGFNIGDAVYGNCPNGAYAEWVVASAGTVGVKPLSVSHLDAASIPVAAQTAWQTLFDHGHLQPGQSVLIHAAAGGVGSFAVQLAHWRGAKVTATASAANLDYVRQLGADHAVDYKAVPFDSVARDLDLVIDLVGGDTQKRSFAILKPGGTLVATSQPPSADLVTKHKVNAVMINMSPTTQGLQQIAALFDAKVLSTSVTKVFPLSQAAQAWTFDMTDKKNGKTALQVP